MAVPSRRMTEAGVADLRRPRRGRRLPGARTEGRRVRGQPAVPTSAAWPSWPNGPTSRATAIGCSSWRRRSATGQAPITPTGIRTSNVAEGRPALARAFLHAGGRGVVCSPLRVDDAATAELTADLYADLKAGKKTAEALRSAQLKMIEAGEPPLHWAPFVLIGR